MSLRTFIVTTTGFSFTVNDVIEATNHVTFENIHEVFKQMQNELNLLEISLFYSSSKSLNRENVCYVGAKRLTEHSETGQISPQEKLTKKEIKQLKIATKTFNLKINEFHAVSGFKEL